MTTPSDSTDLEYERPADHVRTINVPIVHQRIFDGMAKYEDAARGYNLIGFERSVKTKEGASTPQHILISHRPPDAQVLQIYRIPGDPAVSEFERLTHFNIGAGRSIPQFRSIAGDDWRGTWRGGGAIMVMDSDGNEMFQLWRYWEDSLADQVIPKIDGELDNHPGVGRFERLTNDGFRYDNLRVSESNKILAFSSTKENKRDTLIYITKLIGSSTGARADSTPFSLPSKLITPTTTGEGTSKWVVEDISVDDRYILITRQYGSAHRPLYIIDISREEPTAPELINYPESTEKDDQSVTMWPAFSKDSSQPYLVYLITNAYGDFKSVVTYDVQTGSVTHVTTPEPNLRALRSIPWETMDLKVTKEHLFFRANVEGWSNLFVMPLLGPHKDMVIEVKPDWEGGQITYANNALNGNPHELVLKLLSHRSQGWMARLDIAEALQNVKSDDHHGSPFISVSLEKYEQASCKDSPFRTLPATLMRYKSFDGMEIPAMYYHPNERKTSVPLVISIHGGPESQSTSQTRAPIHGYLLNEMGCAVIYPNVRGSSGYGKRFMAADDVEKREDSVRDIEALVDHVSKDLPNEIDPKRIAVMGGSYGGYMVFACLTRFSSKLSCGVANFGIAHWPSFLRNTAPQRRDFRRAEYGDERIPKILEFLERISPINNASDISVPLSIAHGETDSRVTVEEAIRMREIVHKKGIYTELMVCEKEGHGFKQKSVIEFTNAAKIRFLEQFLIGKIQAGL